MNIPKQLQKLIFGQFQSFRNSAIVSCPILTIWSDLRSSNFGILVPSKCQLLKLFGYKALGGLLFLASFLPVSLLAFQFVPTSVVYDPSQVRVVPLTPTAESTTALVKIVFPRAYENKRKSPVNVQLRIEGFPLGTMSQFDRAKEIYNRREGQSVHVIIDNEPYLVYNQSIEDSFDENRDYYDKIMSFSIPYRLEPGQHVIRCFLVRSFGESLKGDEVFDAEVFYFQDHTKTDFVTIDLNKPYLTYNEPQGRYPAHKSNPILLDFYLSNCRLSPDGYKVRFSINGKALRILTKWTPYYLYGLSKGTHKIKLELLDEDNRIVPGFFNVTEREIIIE